MSSHSPKPPSPDYLQQLTETLSKFVDWIAELIRYGKWSELLLLLEVVLVLFCTPGGVVPQALNSWFSLTLPPQYKTFFWLAVVLIPMAALIIAVRTSPKRAKTEEVVERKSKAIKGLYAFTAEDGEIFRSLERESALDQCLRNITHEDFRFGILMGLSGCGKTSFLQAGIVPRLKKPDYPYRGVYVRFDHREPLSTIGEALAQQLEIPLDWLNSMVREGEAGTSFLPLLNQAVEAAGCPVVLFFDQFEQWFVQHKQKWQREPFLGCLKQWYGERDGAKVKIVVSVRSDLSYRLNELQQTLGYSLGAQQVFELEKFTPEQATGVLKAMAQMEQLPCDEDFLTQLTRDELGDKEDGLISPVDLQILAWMITAQTGQQLRAFNRKAFQQFRGVEALLSRYLQRALLALGSKAQREAAVKVLVALTDLDQQVRSGVLTLEELERKLKPNLSSQEIKQAVNWLERGDVRLISPVEGTVGYELAHERLIPAVMQQAKLQLNTASRANQLLERRVNEWLSNNRDSRYLFSWWELLLIERQKPYLVWGSKREQKQGLLTLSWGRIYRLAGMVIGAVLMAASFLGWLWFTPQGQIQQVRWSIDNPFGSSLERVSDWTAVDAAVAIAKDGKWQYAFELVREQVQQDEARKDFLKEFSRVVPRDNSNQAQAQLKRALALAREIDDPEEKSDALRYIATAYTELGDDLAAAEALKDSLKAAVEINNSLYLKSDALRYIATAYTQLEDDLAAAEALKDSLKAAVEIDDPEDKSYALEAIATAYTQLEDDLAAEEGLKDTLKAAVEIDNSYYKSYALEAIATAYTQLEDDLAAEEGLKDTLKAAVEIDNSYYKSNTLSSIATAYTELEDDLAAAEALKDSLKAAVEIDDPEDKSNALSSIATAYTELEDDLAAAEGLKDTLKAAVEIDNSYYKSNALSGIARAYAQLEDDLAAEEALKDSLKAAVEIDNSYYKSNTLSSIATAYTELEDDLAAEEGLKDSLKAAIEIDNLYDKSYALSGIARAYTELEDDLAAEEGLKDSLKAAVEIDNPEYKSYALSSIATAYAQLEDDLAAEEGLKNTLKAAVKINSEYKSYALSSIARAYAQLEDDLAAEEGLKDTLKAAVEIDNPEYKSYALSSIATATANIPNSRLKQSILQATLEAAEAANADEALGEISSQYARDNAWGKALNALKRCAESEKIAALTNILTLWAEKQNPLLIDGAVVLKVEAKPSKDSPNRYIFQVSISSQSYKAHDYADHWEVLTEKGKVLYSQTLEKSQSQEQPFTSISEAFPLDSREIVIVRARMHTDDNDKTGYDAEQAWKGSVKRGFKFIRLSENFANRR